MDDNVQESMITKNDSYTERRKLFKNIWETAISMNDKDAEYGAKPKVIKTLRLSDRDGVNIGKSKKQRIRNLRTVCTRLLDYCDRQEADAMSDQMSPGSAASSLICIRKPKQKKKRKKNKKIKIYSYDPPKPQVQDKKKMSFELEVADGPVTHRGTRPLRDMTSPRAERANLIQQFLNERYNLENPTLPPVDSSSTAKKLEVGDVPRKVVKKHKRARKKISKSSTILPRGTSQMRKVLLRKREKRL